MLWLLILLGALTLGSILMITIALKIDSDSCFFGGIVGSLVFGLIFAVVLMLGLQWNLGDDTYTGYIYSVEGVFDRVKGHIRFSQNAGSDEQPSFCVAKERREELEQYVGKDIKVQVSVPAGFGWSLTGCVNQATIKVMEGGE